MGGLATGSVRPAVGGSLVPAGFAGCELFRGEGFTGSLAPDVEIRPQPALSLRQRPQVQEVLRAVVLFNSGSLLWRNWRLNYQSKRTDPHKRPPLKRKANSCSQSVRALKKAAWDPWIRTPLMNRFKRWRLIRACGAGRGALPSERQASQPRALVSRWFRCRL